MKWLIDYDGGNLMGEKTMVSSKDVAKYAGVSQTTVSRVLNTPESVKEKTRQKVLSAIEALNYHPNAIARSLVSNSTKSIALVSGPLHNPFFADSVTAIVQFARQRGYQVAVHFEDFGSNERVFEGLAQSKVDGMILSSIYRDDPVHAKLSRFGVPFVYFNRKPHEESHYIEIDNEQGGRLGGEHLLALGHRNIAWIGGPLTMSTFAGRFKGFQQVMKENGYVLNEQWVFETDTSVEAIRETITGLFKKPDKPSALFAATDSIAIYALDVLQELGYRIPEDISVMGIDNVTWSRHASFNLTTVSTRATKNIGELGIEALFQLMEKPQTTWIQKTLPVQLIERGTTAAFKKDD